MVDTRAGNMMTPEWENILSALPDQGPFFNDLARATSNTGDARSGSIWLINFVSDYLRRNGIDDSPWAAFDFAIFDIEALAALWPAVHFSLSLYPASEIDVTANLARFIVERMPTIWDGPSWTPHAPCTRALVLADRIDTLVGLFLIGLKPNGSKDPFALRRAAKHVLHAVMFPITRERIAA